MEHDAAVIDAIDRHWAVVVFKPEDRRLAIQAAESAWHDVRASVHTSARAPRLAEQHAKVAPDLASAYERAALERLELLALNPTDRGYLLSELQAAASLAFRLHRAAPLPENPLRAYRALHVAALGVIGAAPVVLDEWLTFASNALRSDPVPERWDLLLRAKLAGVWLDLLRPHSPAALERAFDALGWLRERRDEREAELLHDLSESAAQRMRVYLTGLYHLADAAAALTVHQRRGPIPEIADQLNASFDNARALTAADTALDQTLQWLKVAALRVAGQRTAQIEIPGI